MENLTPGQLFMVAIGLVLAFAGFINQAGSAVEKIVKAWKAAKAPNEAQNGRLDALEEWQKEMAAANLPARVEGLEGWRAEAKEMLTKDKKELDDIHAGLRVNHLAQLALLDHALNGNNIDQMQDAKAALQNYLANK
ncbi:MAG: hypothetical protein IIV90_03225 [Oscillospiraceae bacterium]|nr:hypothetical protein [Oscillospiraceae bacterium]